MKGRQIKVIAPLENFECVGKKIDLSENLRIREMLDKEREIIRDALLSPLMPPHGPVEFLKYGLETSCKAKTEALVEVADPSTIRTVYKVVSALRLYKAGNVGCNIILVSDGSPSISFSGGLPNISFPTILTEKYVLSEGEIEGFKKFWSKFETIEKKNLNFLDVAIRRFNYTYEKQRFDDRLIDCMVSFESLFLRGERQELGYRLSLRVAVMLAEECNKREEIFRNVKTAYDFRSQIVHGEDLLKINEVLKRKHTSWKELSMTMEDYFRKSIRTFFEKVSKEHKDKIIEDLDKGIFDKKS